MKWISVFVVTNRLSKDRDSATKYVQNLVPNLIAMSSNANTDLVIMPAVEFYKREHIYASLLTQNRNLLNLNTKLHSQSTKQTNGLYVFVCILLICLYQKITPQQMRFCVFILFVYLYYFVCFSFVLFGLFLFDCLFVLFCLCFFCWFGLFLFDCLFVIFCLCLLFCLLSQST